MVKKALVGAVLAASATIAAAGPASAVCASNTDTLRDSIQQAQVAEGDPMGGTSAGTGTWGSHYGDVAVGEQHGLINTNGAPFLNVDLRCAVPNADGEGIGGHALLG